MVCKCKSGVDYCLALAANIIILAYLTNLNNLNMSDLEFKAIDVFQPTVPYLQDIPFRETVYSQSFVG